MIFFITKSVQSRPLLRPSSEAPLLSEHSVSAEASSGALCGLCLLASHTRSLNSCCWKHQESRGSQALHALVPVLGLGWLGSQGWGEVGQGSVARGSLWTGWAGRTLTWVKTCSHCKSRSQSESTSKAVLWEERETEWSEGSRTTLCCGCAQEDSCTCPGLPSTPPVSEYLHCSSVCQLYNLEQVT